MSPTDRPTNQLTNRHSLNRNGPPLLRSCPSSHVKRRYRWILEIIRSGSRPVGPLNPTDRRFPSGSSNRRTNERKKNQSVSHEIKCAPRRRRQNCTCKFFTDFWTPSRRRRHRCPIWREVCGALVNVHTLLRISPSI